MKGIFTSKWSRWSAFVVIFLAAVAITFLVQPKERGFNHYFELGKPWSYDLLTAPCDFPIYKSEARLKAEQDSVLSMLEPYYTLNGSVEKNQFVRLRADSRNRFSEDAAKWFEEQIVYIYHHGVVSLDDMNNMVAEGISHFIVISEGNVAQSRIVADVFTVGSAYQYLLDEAEKNSLIDSESLKKMNIESYIVPNLILDERKTRQAHDELMATVMPTAGMVQEGERIVDKGEVVDDNIYQILSSLQRVSGSDLSASDDSIWSDVGSIALIVFIYLIMMSYFYFFRIEVLKSVREVFFMFLMSVSMLVLLYLMQRINIHDYIVPFAMLPLIIRVFFDSRTALYIHMMTILLASRMVSNPIDFVMIQMIAGIVAISSVRQMESRAQLVRSALYILISYILIYTALQLSKNISFAAIDYDIYFVFFMNALSLLFAYLVIYIIEKLFGFLSSVTLVELSNINTPLLMEFSEKCPGTFQHVLQVSNLSVEVAKKIGANPLLVRTGAIYHDIGKMANPMLFTENQVAGVNPLSTLPYEEAAQIIISHVSEGVRIAEKARIPHQIIEFISTHHGKGKVKYFYNSFKNKYPDREIDESLFTYPGPLPDTKEKVILMMADSVEAASRSLKSYSEEAINNMVEGVVGGQVADGQFRCSPISFADVETAKQVFKDKLKNIYHERITYPTLNKPE